MHVKIILRDIIRIDFWDKNIKIGKKLKKFGGVYMNIFTQICGIILLILIFILYLKAKKIGLLTEKLYFMFFMTTLITLILDIVSVYCIVNKDQYPTLILVTCKGYLVLLIFILLDSFLYICSNILYDLKKNWKILCPIIGIVIFSIALVIILPINSFSEGMTTYTYGPATLVAYTAAAIFIVSDFISLIILRNKIERRRRAAMFVWLSMWLIGSLVQLFFKGFLIVSFCASLGLLIAYLYFDNPELNLSQNGLFNQRAAMMYISEKIKSNKTFSALLITFVNEHNLANYASCISKCIDCVNLFKVFEISDDQILVVFTSNFDDTRKFINEIMSIIANRDRINYVFFEKPYILNSELEIMKCLETAYDIKLKNNSDSYFEINQDFICFMNKQDKIKKSIDYVISNDGVIPYLQPIYSTKSKSFVSAEALMRLVDEDGNMLYPNDFIPIAEKEGTIVSLGRILFEKICKMISTLDFEKMGLEYIEINLSVVQFSYVKLASEFIEIMDKYSIDPKRINFEITETSLLTEKNILVDNMHKLIEYGASFSLDDFGTGQSNLNYIIEMPVDIVKFDRNMTISFFENEKAKFVMNAAREMINGLKLEIVSEGVETKFQLDTLSSLGIDYIQGYYFAKPMKMEEFIEFINKHNHNNN